MADRINFDLTPVMRGMAIENERAARTTANAYGAGYESPEDKDLRRDVLRQQLDVSKKQAEEADYATKAAKDDLERTRAIAQGALDYYNSDFTMRKGMVESSLAGRNLGAAWMDAQELFSRYDIGYGKDPRQVTREEIEMKEWLYSKNPELRKQMLAIKNQLIRPAIHATQLGRDPSMQEYYSINEVAEEARLGDDKAFELMRRMVGPGRDNALGTMMNREDFDTLENGQKEWVTKKSGQWYRYKTNQKEAVEQGLPTWMINQQKIDEYNAQQQEKKLIAARAAESGRTIPEETIVREGELARAKMQEQFNMAKMGMGQEAELSQMKAKFDNELGIARDRMHTNRTMLALSGGNQEVADRFTALMENYTKTEMTLFEQDVKNADLLTKRIMGIDNAAAQGITEAFSTIGGKSAFDAATDSSGLNRVPKIFNHFLDEMNMWVTSIDNRIAERQAAGKNTDDLAEARDLAIQLGIRAAIQTNKSDAARANAKNILTLGLRSGGKMIDAGILNIQRKINRFGNKELAAKSDAYWDKVISAFDAMGVDIRGEKAIGPGNVTAESVKNGMMILAALFREIDPDYRANELRQDYQNELDTLNGRVSGAIARAQNRLAPPDLRSRSPYTPPASGDPLSQIFAEEILGETTGE